MFTSRAAQIAVLHTAVKLILKFRRGIMNIATVVLKPVVIKAYNGRQSSTCLQLKKKHMQVEKHQQIKKKTSASQHMCSPHTTQPNTETRSKNSQQNQIQKRAANSTDQNGNVSRGTQSPVTNQAGTCLQLKVYLILLLLLLQNIQRWHVFDVQLCIQYTKCINNMSNVIRILMRKEQWADN